MKIRFSGGTKWFYLVVRALIALALVGVGLYAYIGDEVFPGQASGPKLEELRAGLVDLCQERGLGAKSRPELCECVAAKSLKSVSSSSVEYALEMLKDPYQRRHKFKTLYNYSDDCRSEVQLGKWPPPAPSSAKRPPPAPVP